MKKDVHVGSAFVVKRRGYTNHVGLIIVLGNHYGLAFEKDGTQYCTVLLDDGEIHRMFAVFNDEII